jgi:hypothetical protein
MKMSDLRLAKMAKKTVENKGPEVSSLPIQQDQSPLVIDLPDGQKLVVGHLSNGSVIEVATWRGTGRPDSRTSRLMLGMSSAAEAAEQAKSEAAAKEASKKSPLEPVLEIVSKVIAKLKAFKLPEKAKKAAPSKSDEPSTPFIQTVTTKTSTSTVDTDVDAWLNNLIAKSEEKASKPVAEAAGKSKPKTPAKKAATKNSVRKAAPKSATRRSR